MSNAFPIQTNFTSGEVSPAMKGRVDVQKFFNGGELIRNFQVLPQGGLLRRSGSEFITEVKDSTKLTILKKFVFSTIQAYMLEIGDQYIRIIRDGGVVESGGSPVEVVTPYLEAELRELKFTQSADFLYIAHKNHKTRVLTRSSDISWSLVLFENKDGPYLDQDKSSTELRIVNTVDTATITSTEPDFASGDVGKFVEFVHEGVLLIGEITAYTSSTEIQITPKNNVVDFTTIDPATVIDYEAATVAFPNRLRSTLAIWSTSVENTFIKVETRKPFVLRSGTITDEHSTGFKSSGVGWARNSEAFYVRSGDTIKVRFNLNNVADLDKITLIKASDGTEANVGAERITTAVVGNNTDEIICNYTGLVFVDFRFDDTTTLSAYSVEVNDNPVLQGKWYLTGKNIATNEDIPSSGTAAAYSVDTIEVALIPVKLGTSGLLTLSDREITGTLRASKSVFEDPRDVGRQIRLNLSGTQVWGTISSFTSTTEVDIDFEDALPLDPKQPQSLIGFGRTANWKFGAWFVGNYPQVVNFHEGRLNFYATQLQPQTHWTSKSSSFEEYAPTDKDSTVQDDSGITATLNSGKINTILWAATGPVLLLGTVGAEWQIKAQSLNESLTPKNYNAKEQTSWGSEDITPERIGQSLIYVQVGGVTIRELVYSFEIDSFVANHLNIVADHIFRDRGKAIDIAYERNPYTRIWFVASNGEVVCVTYEKSQEITAWNHHILGGSFAGGNPVTESIEALPGDDTNDEVYLIVKRTIDGVTKRYIERFADDFWPRSDTDKTSMRFTDSHLTYSGAATSTISGLDHLEGETVQIVADGAVRPTEVVSGGSITFQGGDATEAVIGLQYTSLVKTLPVEAGSVSGTAQGKVKRINALVVRLHASIGFSHGVKEDNLTLLSFRGTEDPMDSSPPLFSGDKKITLNSSYDTLAPYFISQDQPYPLNILALMPQLVTHR